MFGWMQKRQREFNELVQRGPREAVDESVKLSNTTGGQSSALSVALPAGPSRGGRLPKRQFLLPTNQSLTRDANFAIHGKQNASFFRFSANERPGITTQQSMLAKTRRIP